MSQITRLGHGVKVATFNNGTAATRVGFFSGRGTVAEPVSEVGKMNLLANSINISNPAVTATQTRNHFEIKSQGLDASSAFNKLHKAIHETNHAENLAKAKFMADCQSVALDRNYEALTKSYALKTAYMGNSLSVTPEGSSEVIERTTADDLTRLAGEKAGGTVVAAVGNVNHKEFCAMVEESLSSLKMAETDINQAGRQPFIGSNYEHRYDSVGQSYGCHIQQAPAELSDDMGGIWPVFHMAKHLVGNFDIRNPYNLYSANALHRIFGQNPKRDGGLDYIHPFYETYGETGVFGYSYKIPNGQSDNSFQIKRVMVHISKLHKRVKDAHVNRAKNAALTEIAMKFNNDPVGVMGTSLLRSNQVLDLGTAKSHFDKISTQKFKDGIFEVLYDQEVAAGKFGATEGMMTNLSIRHNTQSWLMF